MSTIAHVIVPERSAVPRGAKLVGWLVDAATTVAAYLRARRAEREAFARFKEAEEVRRYAYSVRNSDPGFAADLLAAADRHAR